MFFKRKMNFAVLGGDFKDDAKSQFNGAQLMLRRVSPDGVVDVRYTPEDLARFEVVDGTWGEYFSKWGDWSRAITAGAAAGLPVATANYFLRDFIPGQRFIVAWANSIIGAAAAKKALESTRMVTVKAIFKDGAILRAKVHERELTRTLPLLINHLIDKDSKPEVT